MVQSIAQWRSAGHDDESARRSRRESIMNGLICTPGLQKPRTKKDLKS